MANIQAARADVNKSRDLIEWQYQNMQRVYMIGTASRRELSGEVWHFLKPRG